MLGELLEVECSALRRLRARALMVALALLAAEVGALALATALRRAHVLLWTGVPDQLSAAAAAVPLGFDLALVLGSLSFGAAVAAIVRPVEARRLVFPAARTSAGAVSITMVSFFVVYALTLGLVRLVPELLSRHGPLWARAALGALALTPALCVAWLLAVATPAAIALVGRGVDPGRALASGLDHAQRRSRSRWLGLVHVGLTLGLLALGWALAPSGLARLLVLAPLLSLAMLWTVAAFDAAIARDPRVALG